MDRQKLMEETGLAESQIKMSPKSITYILALDINWHSIYLLICVYYL